MAGNDRCPKCGAMVLPQENFCPQCGAALKEAKSAAYDQGEGEQWHGGVEKWQAGTGEGQGVQDQWQASADDSRTVAESGQLDESGWQPGMTPVNIEQLQAFCDYNGMPLERMRFFVGVDYRQPRAFGIYREGDQFVVYKNKSDGSRAVRYHGPDEAHAVRELYAKLLDECHQRNIWPDGKPADYEKQQKKAKRRFIILTAAMVAIFLTAAFFVIRADNRRHAHDGYYHFGEDRLYYLYGSSWYYDDYYDDYHDWTPLDEANTPEDYELYYMGDSYDSEWGYSDFHQSSAWKQIEEENRTDSSDYSSWDSGDTDWDSDW